MEHGLRRISDPYSWPGKICDLMAAVDQVLFHTATSLSEGRRSLFPLLL